MWQVQLGFTLVELMITVAIMAILATIGVSSFTSLVHTSRLSSATNEMMASLHLARSEAIKRNSRVALCPSAGGTPPFCSTSGGWHQGWLVFHDPNKNAVRDADETVILTRQALPAGLSVTGNGSDATYISYAPTGASQTVTLTLCNAGSPGSAREVKINITGRPRTTKPEPVLASCPP